MNNSPQLDISPISSAFDVELPRANLGLSSYNGIAPESLPIAKHKREICNLIDENPFVVITADTGAGKSTQVPKWLYEEGYKVLATQPRRTSTKILAHRVALETGTLLGEEVGFRTAVEYLDSAQTSLRYCTDGLALVWELTKQMGFRDILIIDEVHEWNLNIENLIAWAKYKINQGVPYKVVVMSATMDAEALSQYFWNAPVCRVEGRLFPIEELPRGESIESDAAEFIKQGRDVLIFQPGKREIADCISKLRRMGAEAEILPLHREIPWDEQERCFNFYDRPKCIVATNIARTSLTIPGITVVIDSGMERQIEIQNGVEGLYLRPISMADREQNKGRAGRTEAGFYIDHCPFPLNERSLYPVPEIYRRDNAKYRLMLMRVGIDVEELESFHPQKLSDKRRDEEMLRAVGCLNNQGTLTSIGLKVSEFPVSPMLGRMILAAKDRGVEEEAIIAAAIMEADGFIYFEKEWRSNPNWIVRKIEEARSDLLVSLKAFAKIQELETDELEKIGVNTRKLDQVYDNIFMIQQGTAFRGLSANFLQEGIDERLLECLVLSMQHHIYICAAGHTLSNGHETRTLPSESLIKVKKGQLVVGFPFDLGFSTRDGTKAGIRRILRMASVFNASWIKRRFPDLDLPLLRESKPKKADTRIEEDLGEGIEPENRDPGSSPHLVKIAEVPITIIRGNRKWALSVEKLKNSPKIPRRGRRPFALQGNKGPKQAAKEVKRGNSSQRKMPRT